MHLSSDQIRWIYVYENIDEYKPNRKRKTLTVFDDMIIRQAL